MEDRDTKYCKLCLVTDVKMFSLNTPSILEAFSQLVQVVVCEGYQMYACYECVGLLLKYQEFRTRCVTALNVLSSIHMDHSKITKEVVQTIDRNYYNLESNLACSSVLECNSNDQILIPSESLNTELLENNIDSGKEIESDIPEIKFKKMEAVDTDDIEDVISLSDSNGSNEIRDRDENVSDEIFCESNIPDIDNNDNVPKTKVKRKCLPKLKNSKEKNAGEPLTKRSRITKRNGKTLTRIEKWDLNFFKDYAKVVFLTPEDARNEMLLRKESTNYIMNPYKCDLCYKGFGRQVTYDNHMKKHTSEYGSWECEYCHLRASEKRFLSRHMEVCHKMKFFCKICPYVCFCSKQARGHVDRHKGKKYECLKCGLQFSMSNSLSSHKRMKHPTVAVCALCGSTFAALKGLRAHQSLAHKQDNIELVGPKCVECDVQFATETAWKRHLVLSSKHYVPNGCEECGEDFVSRADLQKHFKLHPRRKTKYVFKSPAACVICKKWLTSDSEHAIHMRTQHSDAEKRVQKCDDRKKFICEMCGKVFEKSWLLCDHRNRHTGERPYECRDCGKTFSQRPYFYAHKRRHLNEHSFQCDYCQKKFSIKQALEKHIKAHLGIRPFECTYCHKYFPHKYEVRMHIDYVHHKQPWPKRDRSKRKARQKTAVL